MNKEKSLLTYFQEGFALANKSLIVYVTVLILSVISLLLSTLFPSGSFSLFSGIFSIIILFVLVGFSISMPLFLQKQQHNALNTNVMVQVTGKNTKRLILPLLLVLILIVVCFAVFALTVYLSFSGNQQQMALFLKSMSSGDLVWSIIGLLLLAGFEYVVFFSAILFSIEDKGFFKSIKESFGLSTKHSSFVLPVVGVNIIAYFLASMLPSKELWGQIITSAITQYVGIIVAGTTLLYYQKVIKK